MSEVHIYTDGACRGNPGPGGWGAILMYNGTEKELWGGEAHTTNNRMELTAVIEALRALKRDDLQVSVSTDSKYVLQGMTEWIKGWKAKGWKTAARKPVLNVDLWQQLDKECARQRISWTWIKGHSGHPHNERADQLANRGIDELGGQGQRSAPKVSC